MHLNINMFNVYLCICVQYAYVYMYVCVYIKFRSIQVYLYSAFHDANRCKAALQKILRFYIIFRSRLSVVTMAEMYSKNHAVSYKLHVIKQSVNTINCNI